MSYRRRNFWSVIFLSFLCNFVSSQNFSWARAIGSTSTEAANSCKVDLSGNVYITGYFEGTIDFDPGVGSYTMSAMSANTDMFILKLDAFGNFIWAKQIGGTGTDQGASLVLDAASNIYLTGVFENVVDFDPGPGVNNLSAIGLGDIFICKLDANGNFGWVKTIGGTNGEGGYSIALDGANNIYTTGYFSSNFTDFDPGSGSYNLFPIGAVDVFISKLDVNGNFVWAKQIGGSNVEVGYSIAVDNTGNSFTTGHFLSSVLDLDPGPGTFTLANNGLNDMFLVKLDASGNFSWANTIGGTGDDRGYSVALDLSGNVYTTGYFSSIGVDFDPGIGTYTLSSLGGSMDAFISKQDGSGNFVWTQQMGGTGTDYGASIFVDGSGYVYTTGAFQNIADFDPGAGTYTLSSNGMRDIFINILDPSGTFYWVGQIGGTNDDVGSSILATPIGEVYTVGRFASVNVDFDCGAGTYSLSSGGGDDIFVHKMTGAPSEIKEIKSYRNYLVYPNPASNVLFIANEDSQFQNSEIEISDITGQVVLSSSYTDQIDVSSLSNGYYIIRFSGKEKSYYSKFVKE